MKGLKIVLVILVVIILLVAFVGLPLSIRHEVEMNKFVCSEAEAEGIPARYTFWDGCMIKIDGVWQDATPGGDRVIPMPIIIHN